jgi:uncharacterized DUF497 family protein
MFVFDPDKSALNKDKHGIDFVEAQEIFADPAALILMQCPFWERFVTPLSDTGAASYGL